MRTFEKIIESKTEPHDINCIWLKGDELFVYQGNGWESIGDRLKDGTSLEDINDTLVRLGIEVEKKVDKVEGKELSTNDFTDALKAKLDSLKNYDDTEMQRAIQALSDELDTILGDGATDAIDTFNEIERFLQGITDSETLTGILVQLREDILDNTNSLLSNKVDKVSGKDLSSNDFTDSYVSKIDNLETHTPAKYLGFDDISGVILKTNLHTNAGAAVILTIEGYTNYGNTPIYSVLTFKADADEVTNYNCVHYGAYVTISILKLKNAKNLAISVTGVNQYTQFTISGFHNYLPPGNRNKTLITDILPYDYSTIENNYNELLRIVESNSNMAILSNRFKSILDPRYKSVVFPLDTDKKSDRADIYKSLMTDRDRSTNNLVISINEDGNWTEQLVATGRTMSHTTTDDPEHIFIYFVGIDDSYVVKLYSNGDYTLNKTGGIKDSVTGFDVTVIPEHSHINITDPSNYKGIVVGKRGSIWGKNNVRLPFDMLIPLTGKAPSDNRVGAFFGFNTAPDSLGTLFGIYAGTIVNSDSPVGTTRPEYSYNFKQLAFTDGGVNSANKLSTERNIFGHPFNGTQDVEGTLDNVTNINSTGTCTANMFKKINGTSSQFLKADGSLDDTNYMPFEFINDFNDVYTPCNSYDYRNGYLVYLTTPSTSVGMITVSIIGNSYLKTNGLEGNTPINTIVQFYNYASENKIIAHSAIHYGHNFGNIKVFNYQNKVCLWFEQDRTFESFFVYATHESYRGNRVSYIDNEAVPTEGVTNLIEITPEVGLRTGNYTDILSSNYYTKTEVDNALSNIGSDDSKSKLLYVDTELTDEHKASNLELYNKLSSSTEFIPIHVGTGDRYIVTKIIGEPDDSNFSILNFNLYTDTHIYTLTNDGTIKKVEAIVKDPETPTTYQMIYHDNGTYTDEESNNNGTIYYGLTNSDGTIDPKQVTIKLDDNSIIELVASNGGHNWAGDWAFDYIGKWGPYMCDVSLFYGEPCKIASISGVPRTAGDLIKEIAISSTSNNSNTSIYNNMIYISLLYITLNDMSGSVSKELVSSFTQFTDDTYTNAYRLKTDSGTYILESNGKCVKETTTVANDVNNDFN